MKTHHDHIRKEFRDINSQALVTDHFFDHFTSLLGIPLNLSIAKKSFEFADLTFLVIKLLILCISTKTNQAFFNIN
jgi:hypothetical protein